MFASKIAMPQTKAAESWTAKRTLQRSPIERAQFPERTVGSQEAPRLSARQSSKPAGSDLPSNHEQEAGPGNTPAAGPGASWNFAQISIHPSEGAERSQLRKQSPDQPASPGGVPSGVGPSPASVPPDTVLANGIKSSELRVNSKPDIARSEAIGDLLATVQPALSMTGVAEVDPKFNPALFHFHFYQIGRPFQILRATYWLFGSEKGCSDADPKPVSTTEGVEDDCSDALRKGGPQQDSKAGEGGWYPLQGLPVKGTPHKPEIPFADTPQGPFGYRDADAPSDVFVRTHLRSAEWTDFFFTAFCVQLPGGTVTPLKSIYWTVRFAEFEKPACPLQQGVSSDGDAKKRVEVGNVMDGAPSEPGLAQAGKEASQFYNDFARNVPHTIRQGPFGINPPAKID